MPTISDVPTGPIRVGVLTVSDRAAAGVYEDRGGPAVLAFLADGCRLVIATGGTGPAARDVTPEAVAPLLDTDLPGFGEKMRADNWARVPTAILARQTCGVRGDALILTLPGSPKAVPECLESVWPAAVHCLNLIAES